MTHGSGSSSGSDRVTRAGACKMELIVCVCVCVCVCVVHLVHSGRLLQCPVCRGNRVCVCVCARER